jgi:ribosomal protein S18 acetylase RimI-like enzyme
VKKGNFSIVPMKRTHIQDCTDITEISEPWRTLHERLDFKKYILLKQAHVCMDGEVLTGFIVFAPEPVFARGGYLRAIGVSPSMRKRGIGRRLLTFAEKETARYSHYLYICVSDFNRAAQAFYHDRGYERAGKLADLIVSGSSEYIYWKRLRPISQKTRREHRD